MTEKQIKVYRWFKKNKKGSPLEIALDLRYSESSYISYPLKVLLQKGYIEKEGSGKNTIYKLI